MWGSTSIDGQRSCSHKHNSFNVLGLRMRVDGVVGPSASASVSAGATSLRSVRAGLLKNSRGAAVAGLAGPDTDATAETRVLTFRLSEERAR